MDLPLLAAWQASRDGTRLLSLCQTGRRAQAGGKGRQVLGDGQNPIKERERLSRIEAKAKPTLEAMTLETFEARKRQRVGDGKAGRRNGPLSLHVLPHLGKVRIEETDQSDIERALAPIWHDKPETARKAITFKHPAASGLDVDLHATEKAKALLAARQSPSQ